MAIVKAAIAESAETGQPVAHLSLDRIAKRAGISRSTMFRRVGSRAALETAVEATGVDPGRRADVWDRAIAAAAEIIVDAGVGALTIEEVARRAGCALTSVHSRFGGRDGLLAAVFERYAPLPEVERRLTDGQPFERFEDGVRTVYETAFDTLSADSGVIEALVAEVLAKPNGSVMRLTRERILPQLVGAVGGWLAAEIRAGRCRDLPLSLLLPMLVSPMSVHLFARKRLIAAGVAVPDRRSVIDTLTSAFDRAVGTGN
jgi:AcrR family transcriptional regulator